MYGWTLQKPPSEFLQRSHKMLHGTLALIVLNAQFVHVSSPQSNRYYLLFVQRTLSMN